MTDIPLRAIAELERRRQQQLLIVENSDHAPSRVEAEGKAEGYQTSIDILKSMRPNDTDSESPDESQTVRATFDMGPDDGFDEYVGLVDAYIERLANDVEKPCEIHTTIDVYDRDGQANE